jgi:hypothetical protein
MNLNHLRKWAFFPLFGVLAMSACATESDFGDGYEEPEPYDPPEPSVNVTGIWDSHWGGTQADLTLTQTGASVSGSYELAAGWGYISGTLSGRTLDGTWSDHTGSGDIEFVFSSDGKSFTGTWSGGNSWTGTKTTDGGSPSGSYEDSCFDCEIDSGRICCYCPANSGWESWTCLDLPCSQDIANCNGGLRCGGC